MEFGEPPSDSGMSSNHSATSPFLLETHSFAQVHDNVASSQRVLPPQQSTFCEIRSGKHQLFTAMHALIRSRSKNMGPNQVVYRI